MLPEILPGDIIFSSAQTWLSKAIRFFEKMQTGAAEFSHVAMGLEKGFVIEALWTTRINPVEKYADQTIEIWRLPLDEEDRRNFRTRMLGAAGNPYGMTKIPLFAADATATQVSRLFGRKKPVFWFTKKAGIFNIPVCSQLGLWGIQKFTKYRLRDDDHKEVTWREMSPDYFHDLVHLPHNGAQLVYRQVAT